MMNGGLKSVITIDQTIDDPYSRVSGDVNGSAIRWIRENSHRYLGKYKDGVMYICQLDDSNSNYYHDGTSAVLTGAEGDVFMRMPNFFYCGTEGDIVDITFSTAPFDNCVPWGNTLIGVYDMYVTNNKGYSRSGVNTSGSISRQTGITYSSQRGQCYQLIDYQMLCVLGALYYAIYGNTDCRRTVGAGNGNYNIAGGTNSLGMTDTVAGGNGDSGDINYFGLEGLWGIRYNYMNDAYVNSGSSYATVYDPVTGGSRQLYVFQANSICPMKMRFGRYLDLIVSQNDPLMSESNSTKGYCCFQNHSSATSSYMRAGGYGCPGGRGSVASFYTNDSVTHGHNENGSRLAFRGSIIEIKDVQTFKSIVAIN